MTTLIYEASTAHGKPATGNLTFTPIRRVAHENGVVLPQPFAVGLVDGRAEIDLEPNTTAWVWQVREQVNTQPWTTNYYVVSDRLEPVNFHTLKPIDPSTIASNLVPEPAWWAHIEHVQASAHQIEQDLYQAQRSTDESRSYATDAGNSAVTAQRAHTESVQHAQRSESQANRSEQQADRAQSAADRATTGPDAAVTRANHAADRATDQANLAQSSADTAGREADRSTTQANRAETQADRAQSYTDSWESLDDAITQAEAARDESTTQANRSETEANRAYDEAERALISENNALAHETEARYQANRSGSEADRATTEANRSATEADRSESEADRATTEADRSTTEANNSEHSALAALTALQELQNIEFTVDTSVGTRVFIGDTMIYGDTGWISLENILPPSIEIREGRNDLHYLEVRRIGNVAHVRGSVYLIDTEGNRRAIVTMPHGFSPHIYGHMGSAHTNDTTHSIITTSNNNTLQLSTDYSPSTGDLIRFNISYITPQDWPTTLDL